MKNCSKCGAQNPDEAQFCYNCGEPFVKTKKIEVHGIKEWWCLYDIPVEIFINDVLFGVVKRNEVKTIELKRINCTMKLTCRFRRTFELFIPAEFDRRILIKINWWTGISAVLAM